MVELINVCGEGRRSLSLIPSILVGVTLGVGPIASSMVNRYGCRVVTIVGAVLASFGIAVSAAAPNIIMLYLTIGLVTGQYIISCSSYISCSSHIICSSLISYESIVIVYDLRVFSYCVKSR